MKTIQYFLSIILLCSIAPLHAQLSLGLKGGATRAWQDYGPVSVPDGAEVHVRGFNIIATAYYDLGKHLSLGIEPGFSERGAACIPGFIIFEGDTKFFLDYIQAPILVNMSLPIIKDRVEVFGKLGYGASYLIGGVREDNPVNDGPSTRTNIDLGASSILNQWDHGAYGGLGFAYLMGKTQLQVEMSYYHGLRNAERINFSQNRSLSIDFGVSRRLF